MVEIGIEALALCLVFATFGSIDFGLRFSDWITEKKWYLMLLIVGLMVAGYFVFERVYGKWIILV